MAVLEDGVVEESKVEDESSGLAKQLFFSLMEQQLASMSNRTIQTNQLDAQEAPGACMVVSVRLSTFKWLIYGTNSLIF
jgi:hypothetical protein